MPIQAGTLSGGASSATSEASGASIGGSDDNGGGSGSGGGGQDQPKSKSLLFCPCGGPGSSSLVKLLPCGDRSLCMLCAQMADACPTCGAGIDDSVPSFRASAAAW